MAPGEHVDAGELFRRHAEFVARFLRHLGMRPGDVEDLVQDVFLTAHRRGGFVRAVARPTTWLAEIALRVASTSRRTKRRRPEELDAAAGTDLAHTGASPAEAAEAREALARVRRALETMDLDSRATFVLFEIEGESCSEIASAFGIPVGTVYSRLDTARRRFLDTYRKLEAGSPLVGVAAQEAT